MSLSGWNPDNKTTLTIPVQSSELTDFPVLVNLSNSSGTGGFDCSAVFAELGLNSKKIAVEVGNTGVQTQVEIERWEADNAQLWVKIPTLSATGSTILNLYYDSTQSDNTTYVGDTGDTPAQAVWDSYFVAVYHMSQDPSAGGACVLDSTSNGDHGTPEGGMTSDDLVGGLVGKALEFDGVNDFININSVLGSSSITDFSVEFAFSTIEAGSDHGSILFSVHDSDDTNRLRVANNTVLRTHDLETGSFFDSSISINDGGFYTCCVSGSSTSAKIFIDGLEDGSGNHTVSFSSGGKVSIAQEYDPTNVAGDFFNGVIDEVRISNVSRSDVWIYATNLSNTDVLVTFSVAGSSVALLAFTAMPYGNLIATNLAAINMFYSITSDISAFVDMPYGIKLSMAMAMYYSDAATMKNILTQYYGDSILLKNTISMKYEDLLCVGSRIDMKYSIPLGLQKILEIKYSLAGDSITSIMNQQYSVLDKYILRKHVEQIYELQYGNKLSQVTASVIIDGAVVSPHHVNVEYSIDSYVGSGEVHLADESEYIGIHQGDDVEIIINGETYYFVVDSEPKRSRSGAAKTNYVITCASPAIELSFPWSDTITCAFDEDTAKNIFESLASPIIVDWKIIDFPITKDKLYASNEDKISIMRKITQSAGAIIQSNPDGSIRVVYRYQTAVNKWSDAPPDYFLTDSVNFISQDETFEHNSGFNKYVVGSESSPEDRIWLEQYDYPNVLAFEVPWKGTEMSLEHSGGSEVADPVYHGVTEVVYPPEGEEAEQIEFIAGFSTSTRPIYTNKLDGSSVPVEVTWVRESLGAITISEDGRIEAEYKTGSTDGYSIATIRYLTRYNLWEVNNGTEKNVQYILRAEGDYDEPIDCY